MRRIQVLTQDKGLPLVSSHYHFWLKVKARLNHITPIKIKNKKFVMITYILEYVKKK